jgi:hypothetical protein
MTDINRRLDDLVTGLFGDDHYIRVHKGVAGILGGEGAVLYHALMSYYLDLPEDMKFEKGWFELPMDLVELELSIMPEDQLKILNSMAIHGAVQVSADEENDIVYVRIDKSWLGCIISDWQYKISNRSKYNEEYDEESNEECNEE